MDLTCLGFSMVFLYGLCYVDKSPYKSKSYLEKSRRLLLFQLEASCHFPVELIAKISCSSNLSALLTESNKVLESTWRTPRPRSWWPPHGVATTAARPKAVPGSKATAQNLSLRGTTLSLKQTQSSIPRNPTTYAGVRQALHGASIAPEAHRTTGHFSVVLKPQSNEALPAKDKAPCPIINLGDKAQVTMNVLTQCVDDLLFNYFGEASIKHFDKPEALKSTVSASVFDWTKVIWSLGRENPMLASSATLQVTHASLVTGWSQKWSQHICCAFIFFKGNVSHSNWVPF